MDNIKKYNDMIKLCNDSLYKKKVNCFSSMNKNDVIELKNNLYNQKIVFENDVNKKLHISNK